MLGMQKPSRPIRAGDLIGFSGHSFSSAVINVATYGIPFWSLSHLGIMGEYHGQLLLFESEFYSTGPCVIQGKPFPGTQARELDTKLRDYRGKAWHYPLYRPLYGFEKKRLSEFLVANIGVPYDRIGAFRAAGVGLSWIESHLRQADVSSLFCSEYCSAAHAHIGIFQTNHVSRWSPNLLARTERRHGILMKPRRLK